MKIILASSSPRRKELLETILTDFEVVSADINEDTKESESPKSLVARLACEKAIKVAEEYPDSLVLAADTVVAINDQILGKPKDKEEAHQMLSLLSGNFHQVYSAYQLLNSAEDININSVSCSKIKFIALTSAEIADYIESGEPMDKAGAYALQGIAAKFIEQVEGSHTSVIGLDIASVYKNLKNLKVV